MTKLFFFFFALSSYVCAQTITISVDGKKHSSISLEDIKKMKTVEVEFFNNVTKRSELYKGVSTLNLIEKIYPEYQNVVEVELISLNEFRYLVSMNRLQRENSIMAFDRADGDKFVRFSQKEKILVNLAPLYLVWDLKSVSAADRLHYSSTYQISEINLLTNKNDFGVHENAVDGSVYLGYQTYKSHCISCHALGKNGGKMSFDLLKRQTLEVKGQDYVMKYIMDPKAVNPQSKMLPLPKFKNNTEMARGVVDFLKFMQNPEELLRHKKAAASETSYKALKEVVNQMR